MKPGADVVVVGCGIAGLAAAVSAAAAGARVTVVERAPRAERGGNTRYTESLWRMRDTRHVADDLEERLCANAYYVDPSIVQDAVLERDRQPPLLRGLPIVDPALAAGLVRDAPATIAWLEGFGVRFEHLGTYFVSQSTTRLTVVGGGLALIEALAGHVEHGDAVDFRYECLARDLVTDDTGAVAGLRVRERGHGERTIPCRAVVLACGGFQGNPEMLARYLGPQAVYTRPVARGGYFNQGDGHRMALALGAAPAGEYSSFHAQPVDPRSADPEPVLMHYAYGVLVNRTGRRFTDEGAAPVDASYEVMARRVNREPEGIAYLVTDARLEDVPGWRVAVRSGVPPVTAAAVPALASAIGVDGAVLGATLEAYNRACAVEPGSFDPYRLDGLATTGVDPPKSNWARPVDRPPYRCWPIVAANCFTFGGLKIDGRARVIDRAGDAIVGLYAAGELVGLYYGVYPGSTSVMRGAITGRWAGADAAAHARGRHQELG